MIGKYGHHLIIAPIPPPQHVGDNRIAQLIFWYDYAHNQLYYRWRADKNWQPSGINILTTAQGSLVRILYELRYVRRIIGV